VLGTTGQAYVDRFSKALGQPALTTIAQNIVQPQQAQQQAAQPTQFGAPIGLPFSAQPMPQIVQQPIEQTSFNLVPPQTPRRVNVTGLLQLLQNAPPSVRGLLAQG
jgi:hypothetical protein